LVRNGFKRSESGFDTNETNPFLSISIHFRLLGLASCTVQVQVVLLNISACNSSRISHIKSSLHFRWQLLSQPSAINWRFAGALRRAISQYCFDKASFISVSLCQMRTKRYRASLQVHCFDEWHSGVAKSRAQLIFEFYYTRDLSYSLSAFVYQKITSYAESRAQPIDS